MKYLIPNRGWNLTQDLNVTWTFEFQTYIMVNASLYTLKLVAIKIRGYHTNKILLYRANKTCTINNSWNASICQAVVHK